MVGSFSTIINGHPFFQSCRGFPGVLPKMELDERLLTELEAMGFSKTRASEALSSGNSSIEAAIDWLVDHGNDPAATEMQMPEGLVNIDAGASNSFNISEQVKLRAHELRNKRSRKKAEQEKQQEREREKERIRAGKELLDARRMAEESERKRYLAQRKAEKEEERRARGRIRQKLLQDKLERQGLPRFPREEFETTKSNPTLPGTPKNLSTVDPYAIRENMRQCLTSIKHQNEDDNSKATRTFQTLLIYVANIINNPDEDKFRKIRIGNPAFQDRVGRFEQGIEFLQLCGFERVEGDRFLSLPEEKLDIGLFKMAWTELQNALTNPFFGLFTARI